MLANAAKQEHIDDYLDDYMNKDSKTVAFYRNFYKTHRNHERESEILEKCLKQMPVNRFLYFTCNTLFSILKTTAFD